MTREIAALGFGATAVSRGELDLAARAGFDRSATVLEGIGKTTADLRRAVGLARAGSPLAWVSLESPEEAQDLAELARRPGGAPRHRAPLRIDVLIRLNPRVRPETHHGLSVGATDSKFGVLTEEVPAVVEAGGGPEGPLRWRGFHVHVGSQLGAVDAWRSAFRIGLAVLALHRGGLPGIDTLDVGGGFPVGVADEPVPVPKDFARAAREILDEASVDDRPLRLAIEPGRAVVARSGWIVARVLHVRPREPRQVVLDAGMTELIRPALYGARHPIVALTSRGRAVEAGDGPALRPNAGAPGRAERSPVVVHGPVCESTDRLGEAELPPVERGDLVAISAAGAYASAMSSSYNGRPRPPELAWDGSRVTVLRPRGSIASLP